VCCLLDGRAEGLDKEDSDANVLNGFAGAYGGLFSSTVIVVAVVTSFLATDGVKYVMANRSTKSGPRPARA
jgi:hypothetical protein